MWVIQQLLLEIHIGCIIAQWLKLDSTFNYAYYFNKKNHLGTTEAALFVGLTRSTLHHAGFFKYICIFSQLV